MASSICARTWASLFSNIRSQLSKPIVSRRSTSTVILVRSQHHVPVKSVTSSATQSSEPVSRRSGNYQPSVWDDDSYLQSLHNPYTGEVYSRRVQKLIDMVKTMLNATDETIDRRLELIDSLERLGLAYHFKTEIKDVLEDIYKNMTCNGDTNYTLHTTALQFRLLRDHGYRVSQDIFGCFKDKNGGFKASISQNNDVKGMLSLYEASFYGMEGESVMDEAMDMSRKYLKDVEKTLDDAELAMEVKRALEVPLRWKVDRLEARWSIHAFEKRGDTNPLLIELAKLDYNSLQALYQDEVKEVSRWWKSTNLGPQVRFSRNKIVSSYLWGIGVAMEPRFANGRKMVGKSIAILATIDDMYDIYGTLDELQLFTDAVERWDINAMKDLPEYMKIIFFALYNLVNETAYDVLKDQGSDIVLYLKNAWLVLVKAYLVEAKWYHTGHAPTLEEYFNNGWVSIAVPMIIAMCYAVETKQVVETEMEYLQTHPDILRWTSMMVRLEDDLGTSSNELERGDVLKSIQCYMHETGASEEAAREHVRQLTRDAWNKIKKCLREEVPLPQSSIEFMVNFARISHFFYRHGDGHSDEDYTKELASDLLFEPIPLNYEDEDAKLTEPIPSRSLHKKSEARRA